jgi:hypothetical protein
MTIWLDGQTGGTGQFKAECFDAVTVAWTAMPAPLCFASVACLSENQMRLVLRGEPGTSVTIQQSNNLMSWLPLTNLINTTAPWSSWNRGLPTGSRDFAGLASYSRRDTR